MQQAAYGLLNDAERELLHLKLGRLLYEHASEQERTERLFDIVNHYNQGMRLIESQEEKDFLAGLNLLAGRKAKESAANKPASIRTA